MHLSASVKDLRETPGLRGISDRAPLQIALRHRPPQPSLSQPIPQAIFKHPDFQKFLEECWASLDLSLIHISEPTRPEPI
eukprot:1749061-Pyramimonas_sp.AAC.1